jgi:hypothetical protein
MQRSTKDIKHKKKAYRMPDVVSEHRRDVALLNWQPALKGGNILEGIYSTGAEIKFALCTVRCVCRNACFYADKSSTLRSF